ncbi:MAG: ATP-binding protein [Syntrophobacterales bacterium]|jgi:NtrC-family two-component system sensor histidine kinase KinB
MPSFRRKILFGYGASLILVVVVLAWAMFQIWRLGQASDSILEENYRSILAAENMIDAVERQDSAVLLILLGFKEQGHSELRDNETIFLQWLGRAKDNITVKGEKEVIEAIERGYTKYLGEVSNLRLTTEADNQRAIRVYHEDVLPLFRSVRDFCIKLREINHETMYAASNRAHNLAIQAVFSISVIGFAAVIIGILFSLFLSRLISRPVTELSGAVSHLAQGDYEIHVPVRGTGELALLAQQFNLMAEKLGQYHAMNIGEIIAEKRKSEAIIQSVDDGLVVVDEKLLVSDINPEAARIFGANRDDCLGKHILEVVREEKLVDFIRQSLDSRTTPKIPEGEDVFTASTEGRSQHFHFSISPMRSPGAEIKGVILLLRDITRLHELDRLKSEFVMTASHELRTPLTSIGMSVDMLLESAAPKLTDKEKELLTVCHEEVQRLRALVNDLLDLSRIEAGKLEMAFEPVSPGFLGEQAVAIMKSQAEAKNLQLTLEVPATLPDVLADPTKIEWVLVNLLANAVRYTPDHGHISLKGESIGGQVHFSVSDDGEGVPYELQSRIFDKFVQVKGAGSPEGSGLGLAICKEIVRAHRGTIWLDSTPGHGSTFTFTLPFVNESIQRS